MKNILVPVDFSDFAINVIDMAAKIALQFQSKVWLIHVAFNYPYYTGLEMGTEIIHNVWEDELSRMEHDLQAMESYLLEKGVDVTALLLEGKIVKTILEQSQLHDSDLIVIGSKNIGVFYRAFLGSVSEGVLKKASCPVLIVPTNM